MAIASLTLASAPFKKAGTEGVKIVGKEIKRRVKKEIAKRVVGKVADASESEHLAKNAGVIASKLMETRGRKSSPRELPSVKTVVLRNGPEDVRFALRKDPQGPQYQIFDRSKFTAGTEKAMGRRLTPDAAIVDLAKREIFFAVDMPPSECARPSFAVDKISQSGTNGFGVHHSLRPMDRARISFKGHDALIKRNDALINARPEKWRNPEGLPPNFQEKLLLRIPSEQTDMINALDKALTEAGRNPEIVDFRGVTSIKYDTEKSTWEGKEAGIENGKKVYELNAGKNADGIRNPDRLLLNQHPLPEDSVFRVKMAGGVEATYETDTQGRVCKMSVKEVKIVPEQERLRDPNRTCETRNIKDGYETDQGGHLLGDEFGGSSDQINLVPMDGRMNQYGSWRLVESRVESALKGSPAKAVTDLNVVVRYDGASARPTSFRVSYRVEGDPVPQDYSILNVVQERNAQNAA